MPQIEILKRWAMFPHAAPGDLVEATPEQCDCDLPEGDGGPLFKLVEVATPEPPPPDRKAELKDEIEALTGERPRGNPSVSTLETQLAEARAAVEE